MVKGMGFELNKTQTVSGVLAPIIGLLYASFTAIRQTDIKRIIAYSSIAHMNLVVLGIFSFTIIGLEGSIIQSVNHGFVSGGLFLLVGILYDRYHSRLLYYYSGLVHVMPIYSFFLLIFTFCKCNRYSLHKNIRR